MGVERTAQARIEGFFSSLVEVVHFTLLEIRFGKLVLAERAGGRVRTPTKDLQLWRKLRVQSHFVPKSYLQRPLELRI